MSRKGKREGKTTAKQRLSTRQLMNTRRITEYSLETYDGDELVYFMIRPTNLSVLSESSVGARRRRAEEERNPVIRQLLERDQIFLDRIQVQMATAREFLILIRLRNQKGKDVFSYLDRIEKSLKEQGFDSRRADEEDIKRILAVYYEQNVTSEKFEDFDGARWKKLQ